MKEVKRTPVPLPGARTQSKLASTPSKAPLSQEFITSDDDAPETTIAIHRPKGTVKSSSKSNPRAKVNAPTTSLPKTHAQPKKPTATTAKQANAQKAADSSSSEQTDVSESETQAKSVEDGKFLNRSNSSSSSSSSSGSSSEDSDKAETRGSTRESLQPPSHASRPQSYAAQSRPVPAFVPPRDFHAVPLNDKTISKAARIFGNLQGKEIWHVTAPAGVSLKDLKEMAMDQVMNGDAILEHRGSSYAFSRTEKSEDGERQVVAPMRSGYKAVSAPVSRTLHLQAVVRLPESSTDASDKHASSEAAASITRSTIRAPRPQVKGLKMRFLPTGFGGAHGGTVGDSESEEDNALRLPTRKKEKRKNAEANGLPDAPPKKHKKVRTAEELRRKEEKKARKDKMRAQGA